MKKVLSILVFSLFAVVLSGQYDPKENFYDAEFFFAEEDYAEALYSFKQVYEKGYQENANINYRIGVCLLNLDGRKTEAIPYLLKAIENISDKYKEGNFKEEAAPPDALLYLGNAYRIDYQLDKAKEYYNKYLAYVPESSSMAEYTRIQVDACNVAVKAVENPVDYRAGTLGQMNDVKVPVYNMAVSGDLNTVAFMGRHKFYNGVYFSRNVDGKWTRPLNITPSIQSDGNQDVLSVSYDGNEILVAWRDQFDSEIYSTKWANNRWNKSQPIGKPVNSKYYESHACLTPDSKTIYFTSNRKESIGEMDIFRCDRNEDGSWGDLQLLGPQVNSPLNEESPFVSADGKRLYFSSQGHNGMGGFDIFYVQINEDGTYGNPVNLGYPLNTTDDDFAFMPKQIDYNGYLTAYNDGRSDLVDLLRFEMIPENANPVQVAFLQEQEPAEEVAQVVEETMEEATPAEEATEMEEAGDVIEEAAEAVGAEEAAEAAEEVAEVAEEAVEEAVPEEAEEPVMHYIIRPVFFDFDSDALTANARQKLDDLVTVLSRFPEATLMIKGHTDAVGDASYNQALAERRAMAVKKYLLSKGITNERLKTVSLGETEHIAINRTADDHDAPKGRALNRRVEFEVKHTSPEVEVMEVEVPEYLKIK